MSTSLQTTNYGFGKYAPDDLTSYLTDYNRAMDKIDGAIKGVSDVANEAKATGDSNLNNIASLSEGLTATNKNVENLGKTQTAQQVEIDRLRTDLDNVNIGEVLHGNSMTGGSLTAPSSTISVEANKVGEKLSGFLSSGWTISSAKTADKAISYPKDGIGQSGNDTWNLYELAYIVGNPFELPAGVVHRCSLLKVDGSEVSFSTRGFYEYDAVSNKTRFYLGDGNATLTQGTSITYQFIF